MRAQDLDKLERTPLQWRTAVIGGQATDMTGAEVSTPMGPVTLIAWIRTENKRHGFVVVMKPGRLEKPIPPEEYEGKTLLSGSVHATNSENAIARMHVALSIVMMALAWGDDTDDALTPIVIGGEQKAGPRA